MDSLSFLAPLLGFAGVAVIVLAIVAIVQDLKQERKYGYRQAFYTIVTLVMLVMAVGAIESLMVVGLKETIPGAKKFNQRYNPPPTFYMVSDVNAQTKAAVTPATSYTCTTDCQFTDNDKLSFRDWKTNYANWKTSSSSSLQTRRNIAGALSLLIIALPLYLFFMRWMNRGAKEEYAVQGKPSPLRSIYFYGLSFGGLVVAVVGGAFMLNTALNMILKTNASDISKVAPMTETVFETGMIDSVVACADKCGFTADDVQLAKDWKIDWQTYRDMQNSNGGSAQNDLANSIPLVLVGFPLFWFHFTKIRREGHEDSTPAAPTPTTV